MAAAQALGSYMKTLVALLLAAIVPSLHAETRAIVAAGLGGEPAFDADFQRQAGQAADALERVSSDVSVLLGDTAGRAGLEEALGALARRSRDTDVVVVVLIGHGSYDDRTYRFNVPGPDVTGEELAAWLDEVPAQRQLVVAATSASGALQSLLTGDQRMIVTATRSGGERNVTVFARYFTESLTDGAADTDKDGYVSAAEAFRFAQAGVAAHYEERGRMATEHPLLEGPELDLALARLDDAAPFSTGSATDREQLAALEAQIEALRADKDNRAPDAYYADLQRLLLEMALLRRQLKDGGGS